jgi:DNA-binding phage protein
VLIDSEALRAAIALVYPDAATFTAKVEAFARDIGTTKRGVYFYLSGERTPNLQRLLKIQEALRLKNISEIIKKAGAPE